VYWVGAGMNWPVNADGQAHCEARKIFCKNIRRAHRHSFRYLSGKVARLRVAKLRTSESSDYSTTVGLSTKSKTKTRRLMLTDGGNWHGHSHLP
jgi:hypothetical protein